MALSDDQERAIGLLILNEKKTVIAQKCHVTRDMIYQWLKNKDFKLAMEVRRNQMIVKAENYILNNTQTYLERLSTIALDDKGDVKTKSTVLMYLIDRGLGKVATKVEVESKDVVDNSPLKSELMGEFAKFRQIKDVEIVEIVEIDSV